MSQKRKRSVNWDEEEKALLKEVMKKYAKIIENKCLKTNTNKLKLNAWNGVLKEFNEQNCRARDLPQIQAQWKSMKINARSAVSSFRQEILRTGGGPKPPSPSQENVEILDLLNPGELVVDYNKYDSDGVPGSHVEEINTLEITQKSNDEKQVIDCIIIEDLIHSKIDENQIKLKMQPEQSVITTPINNTTPSSSAAKKILQSQNQNIGKRHISMSNKMDYAKDALSHTKKLKDAEHQKYMEMAEEEHKLKIALLKEQLKHAEMQSRAMEFENKAAEFRAKAAEFQMMTAQYNMEAAKSKSDK